MSFKYTIQEIATMCGGELIQTGNNADLITGIVTDSRVAHIPENSLFVAIKGERYDGHIFVKQIVQKNVDSFLISSKKFLKHIPQESNVVLVKDTLKALQKFATAHRGFYTNKVIAITGSNGKTIVKEWLAQLFSPEKKIARSPMSFNSQIGVPLSVLLLEQKHDIAIFEAGISKPREMDALEDIIKPNIGIFTGIGSAHDEFFRNRKEKVEEKLKLFKKAEHIICFNTDSEAFDAIEKFARKQNVKLITIGNNAKSDLQFDISKKNIKHLELQVTWRGDNSIISLPFTDTPSIRNAITCLATMLHIGYSLHECGKRIKQLEPIAMRMEQIEGFRDCILINDSYNNDLSALHLALDHLMNQKQRPKHTLILSDIYQSGMGDDELANSVAELVNGYLPTRFIGIGAKTSKLKGKLNVESHFFSSTEEFLNYYPLSSFNSEIILLKGARSFRFEMIMENLQKKSHRTRLEINLDALVHNLNFFKSQLKSSTKIMAMVKAASYGAGNFEIASVLQFHRADYLAVAYADEGIELRKAGITIPIMVMNAEQGAFQQMISNLLEPEIYSFEMLDSFADAVKHHYLASGSPYPIHIEVDTGMKRLGFELDDIPKLIKKINETSVLEVKSVFSHLATADNTENKSFALLQINRFKSVVKQLNGKINKNPLFHLLNSEGVLNYPEAQFDMVRLGIGLYGIVSDKYTNQKLKQVFNLRSFISQIRNIKNGESVGYNRSFIAKIDTTIATIAIGYADGFSRKLGNGVGKVLINEKLLPVVGDVCMDMIMVDVTGHNDVAVGDEVIIFNEKLTVSELAKVLETIPYEILTSVAARVKRTYLNENS